MIFTPSDALIVIDVQNDFCPATRGRTKAATASGAMADVGGRLAVPLVKALVVSAYGDYDPTTKELVDLGGSATLRDACGCATLRLAASHRVGRDGVDAALSLVLTPK